LPCLLTSIELDANCLAESKDIQLARRLRGERS
jgi:hypothetical protein